MAIVYESALNGNCDFYSFRTKSSPKVKAENSKALDENVDFSEKISWIPMFEKKVDKDEKPILDKDKKEIWKKIKSCFDASILTLEKYGMEKNNATQKRRFNETFSNRKGEKSSDRDRIEVAIEKKDSKGKHRIKPLNNARKGIEYIEAQLNLDFIVMVGEDRGIKGENIEYGTAADHYLIIIGKGKDSIGKYFLFIDSGRYTKSNGISSENKYRIDENDLLSRVDSKGKVRKVVQIRVY